MFPETHGESSQSQDTCRCQCDRDVWLGAGLAISSRSSGERWGDTSACGNGLCYPRTVFQAGKRMLSSSPCSLEFQGLLQIPEHRGYVNTNYISMPSDFVSTFLLKRLVPSAVGISIPPPPSPLLTVNWALRLIRARVRNSARVDSNIPLLVPPRTSCCYLLNVLKSLLPWSPGDIYLPWS